MSTYYTNLKPGYSDILKRQTSPTTVPTTQTPTMGQMPTATGSVPGAQSWTSFQNYANRLPSYQVPTVQPQAKTQVSLPPMQTPQVQTVQSQPQVTGGPQNDPSGGAARAAQAAGQAQEKAQAQAMATASQGPSQAAGAVLPPVQPAKPDYETLKDPGQLTEAGKLYSDYITSVLKGDRAIAGVDSARSDAERRNALGYSNALRIAQETAAQAGLQPGTAGYQRIINEAMAGSASQNLDRTNAVNQLQRQGYQDILGLGKGLEDTSRTDAIGERNFQTDRADVAFNRSETARLEKQTQEMAAINSIEDPKARQAALNQYLQSQQGNYGAVLGLFNPDGSLKPEFASINPAQASYQQRIAELKAYYPGKTDAEIQAMAQSEREQERAITRAPIETAADQKNKEAFAKELAAGRVTQEALNSLDPVSPQSIPLGSKTKDFLAQSKTGGWVNIGGAPYKVVSGGSSKTLGDYAVIRADDGQERYLTADGRILDILPKGGASNNSTTAAAADSRGQSSRTR